MHSEIKDTLDFVEKFVLQEQNNTKSLLEYLQRYGELLLKLEAKQPYHINLIDELRANENAHSRILGKLLQQTTSHNQFEILKSFIEYLTEKNPALFYNLKIENPIITQEKERIDLWIRDNKNYAIVFENKIHYACEQDKQLERYIDKTIEQNFENEQIFVIYLSPRHEEPSEQSWGKYKDDFKDRYLNLSFDSDILQWLNEKVLPNIRLKDVFLKSAVEQYIDHLEGFFSLRTTNNKMNMELQEFIKQELGLNGTPEENLAKLSEKYKHITDLSNQIFSLIAKLTQEIEISFFEENQKKYAKKYPTLESVYNKIDLTMGFRVLIDNSYPVRVVIAIDQDHKEKKLYCQVDTERAKLPDTVIKKMEDLLPVLRNNQMWKYFDRNDYDTVLKCFDKVMTTLLQ
ncbi:MAG: PD-(D/E)XK nuclease family protein [Bacteroidales bacterium]